jgi:hypothetical protein
MLTNYEKYNDMALKSIVSVCVDRSLALSRVLADKFKLEIS